jgi:hypothetical protein
MGREDSLTKIREGLDLTKMELPPRLCLKEPADVGLERGPTPIIDMPLSTSSRILSHCESDRMSNMSEMHSEVAALHILDDHSDVEDFDMPTEAPQKPLLFQAVKIKKTYQWEALGVYDDGDLLETSCLLLYIGGGRSFLWFGSNFFANRGAISGECNDSALCKWAEKVVQGDLPVEPKAVFAQRRDTRVSLSLSRQGDESELFWQMFADGY